MDLTGLLESQQGDFRPDQQPDQLIYVRAGERCPVIREAERLYIILSETYCGVYVEQVWPDTSGCDVHFVNYQELIALFEDVPPDILFNRRQLSETFIPVVYVNDPIRE